jgi:hypothetical protein
MQFIGRIILVSGDRVYWSMTRAPHDLHGANLAMELDQHVIAFAAASQSYDYNLIRCGDHPSLECCICLSFPVCW